MVSFFPYYVLHSTNYLSKNGTYHSRIANPVHNLLALKYYVFASQERLYGAGKSIIMELIIVESPTKARTLSRFLGKGYEVEATMGHIKDLPKSKLSVDIEHDFDPLYEVVEKKLDVIGAFTKHAKSARHIYIATDPDREGEAIAKHVEDILTKGIPEVKASKQKTVNSNLLSRIVFHEITEEAVNDAIAHPRKVDKNLVDAQIARRVLDRLVGYTLSPLLWKKVRRGLSAGRVQSVAVRLIVEREREIAKFKAEEYWEIYAILQESKTPKSQFTVQLVKIGDKKAEIDNKKDADEVVADLKKSNYKVFDVKRREVRKNPYPPYTTSTMTQAAARIFGWSAKKTMSIAQKLYEEGNITYHRTDSVILSKTALSQATAFIKEKYGQEYLPSTPRVYKTKAKVAQEAHEAIRPTKAKVEPKDLAVKGKFMGDAKKLYELIWRRFISCQMSASVYDETTINVEAKPKAGLAYYLRAGGQVMKFDGWRKVIPSKMAEDGEQRLPELKPDDPLSLIKVDPQQKFTQPPARYNEASIIKTLEALGIGRPSTYAPIISTIQTRQYVEKDEGKFKPTPVGGAVTDFLVKYFPEEVDYSFTKEMEDELDSVANGELDWRKMMSTFWKPYDKKVKDVTKNSKRVKIETEKLGKKCPDCKDGELVIRIGRFGKFVSCSNFPECKHTEKYMEKIGMKCPKCKEGDVILKKSGWKKFYGCSRYPECDFASWKDPRLPEGSGVDGAPKGKSSSKKALKKNAGKNKKN